MSGTNLMQSRRMAIRLLPWALATVLRYLCISVCARAHIMYACKSRCILSPPPRKHHWVQPLLFPLLGIHNSIQVSCTLTGKECSLSYSQRGKVSGSVRTWVLVQLLISLGVLGSFSPDRSSSSRFLPVLTACLSLLTTWQLIIPSAW